MLNEAGRGRMTRYLVMDLEGVRFALELECVVEIRGVPPLDRPGRAEGRGPVRGTMEVRGQSVRVYDLRRLVGLRPWRPRPDASVVLVRDAHRLRGLLVDRVLEIVELPKRELDPVSDPGPLQRRFVRGTIEGAERIVILDPEPILAACEDSA